MTDLEAKFLFYWKLFAPAAPEPEHDKRFHSVRRWRADFIWRDQMVITECEGGVWTRGRHVRGGGFEKDVEKYNMAVSMGYRLFRVTSKMLKDDPESFVKMVREAVAKGV